MTIRTRDCTGIWTWIALSAVLFISSMSFAQVKIMPLGNSITDGADGSSDQAGYRSRLAALLDAEGVSYNFVGSLSTPSGAGFDNNHEGHDGFTADEIRDNLTTYLSNNPPDIVILHIGTNDITGNQGVDATADEIDDILEGIKSFNPNIKIIIASIVPRNDSKDQSTTDLNRKIEGMYLEKRGAGMKIFFAGINQAFKCDPEWETTLLNDAVHPNNDGYGLMAQVLLNLVMNAINNSNIAVTDNFQRQALTDLWESVPENVIQNGALVNNATETVWRYLAIYKGITNANIASMKWATSSDALGVELSGLVLGLDRCDATSANGYGVTVRSSQNQIRLWSIENGELLSQVDSRNYSLPDPAPGDVLRVEMSSDGSGNQFEVFINDVSYGILDDSNPGSNPSPQYSGIIFLGNQNNNIEDFSLEGGGDLEAPAQILDLALSEIGTTSMKASWTAPGDDGSQGTAASYDLRFSTQNIASQQDFDNATPVGNLPNPSPAGSPESATVLGLEPGTTYFFAIRAQDTGGNASAISNVPSATTAGGDLVHDDFNRSELGNLWDHDGTFAISNGELTNSSIDPSTWDLAVYRDKFNPAEVSFKWGTGADVDGIDQGGIAVMLDAPSASANGYLITRRPERNEYRLWQISGGGNPVNALKFTPSLDPPQAGDEFRVVISSDESGNHFTTYINGVQDITLTDPAPTFIDAEAIGAFYAGVQLVGGLNNNIDDFKLVLSPTSLQIVSGNNQLGAVGEQLPNPIIVRLKDGAGLPIANANVNFVVTLGNGSLGDPSGGILIEAETGNLSGGMVVGNDGDASGGQFIHVPDGQGTGTGSALYTFELPFSGTWYMIGRAIYPDALSDALKVRVDGGTEYVWDVGQRDHASDWDWDYVAHRGSGSPSNPQIDPVPFILNQGIHTLEVIEGKDGVQLDQMVFSTNPNLALSGAFILGAQLTVATDVNGEAAALWTLGSSAGVDNNAVSVSFAGGLPVEFRASATVGAPGVITKLAGDNQQAEPGTLLPTALSIQVTDNFNNPLPNTQTTWTVITGNGTLSTPNPIFTDANANASNTLTTSTDTSVTEIQVTAQGYTGPPVIFRATAIAGAANAIRLAQTNGNNQTGSAGRALAQPFNVEVIDAVGVPVANHSVTFSVSGGNGNFNGSSQTTVTTNASGIAGATLTLGPTAGATNTVQVTSFISGTSNHLSGSPLVFTATAANAQTLEAVSSLSQSGAIDLPLPDSIKVLVKDSQGQLLSGYNVTFTVSQGGGKVNGSTAAVTVQTKADGIARVRWTLGPSAGTSNNKLVASATVSGQPLSGSPIEFSASAELPTMETVSPLTWNGTVGQPLPNPIQVRLRSSLGSAVSGFPVTFTVNDGNGKVNGSSNPVSVNTNAEGIAEVTWTLGPSPGTSNNKLTASATAQGDPIDGSPIEFTASAQIGAAAALQEISGNNQSGMIQGTLGAPLVVQVNDGQGNPISGWVVTFEVTEGGGNLDGNATRLVSSDANGRASVTLTLGSVAATPQNPFNNKVRVSSDNEGPLAGSPVIFQAKAIATGARNLTLVAGGSQSSQAGLTLPTPLQAKVTDDTGVNPIVGHAVRFRVLTGGGMLGNNAATDTVIDTDQNGVASISWTLGGSLGTNSQSVQITADDGVSNLSGSPLTVFASASTGAVDANASTLTSDVSEAPADGQSLATITVTLTDLFGNPIPGKPVTLLATGSSNIINQPLDVTDASGQVTGSIRSTVAEVKTVSAMIIGGIQISSTVNIQFTSLSADKISVKSGNGQVANVGTALSNPIEVLVADQHNNPAIGVTVQFSVTGNNGFLVNTGSGTGTPASTLASVTDANGIADVMWVVGANPGSNSAQATASFNGSVLAGSPLTFTATGVTASASAMVEYSGNSQTGAAGEALSSPLAVQVLDDSGRPISGETVNFSVLTGGGKLSTQSPKTDHMGIARTRLTLGPIVGSNSVLATHASLGSQLVFTAEGLVGPPANLTANSNRVGSGVVNTTYEIAIMILDGFGNAVEDANATFQITKGAGTIETQDAVSDAFGIATAEIRLPTTVGTTVIKASSTDLPGFFELFTITVLPGSASQINLSKGNSQNGTVGRELVYPLQVLITDQFGNAVSGQEVNWIVQNGNSVNPQTSTSDEKGVAGTRFTIVNLGTNQAAAFAFGLNGSPVNFEANGVSNKFPLFVDLTDQSVAEGSNLSLKVFATDDDGDPVTYDAENLPTGASFTGDTFDWTPAVGADGDYNVTLIARDNRGGLDAKEIQITVLSTNNAPLISSFSPTNLDIEAFNGQRIQFSITASDADNDPLSYKWLIAIDANPGGTLVSTSSTYEFIADNFESRSYTLTAEVTDGRDVATMSWKVDRIVTSVELTSFRAQFTDFAGVKISWVTSREVNNTGFNILRSPSRNGSFERINEELIESRLDGRYEFFDSKVSAGSRYFYQLEDVDLSGQKTQHGPIMVDVSLPETFELTQNFPNPFNPETKIRYQLPREEKVLIRVVDILGREVRTLVDEHREAGFHVVTWDARDNHGVKVGSGIYYYQIVAGEFTTTKKMTLLK